MEYTTEGLLSKVKYVDLMEHYNFEEKLKNVKNPKNGRFATVEDLIQENECDIYVVEVSMPDIKLIATKIDSAQSKEEIVDFVERCVKTSVRVASFENPRSVCITPRGCSTPTREYVWELRGYAYPSYEYVQPVSFYKKVQKKRSVDQEGTWEIPGDKYWFEPEVRYDAIANATSEMKYIRAFDNADEMMTVANNLKQKIKNQINHLCKIQIEALNKEFEKKYAEMKKEESFYKTLMC